MATEHVYHLQFWSRDEDRPWIDFDLPENAHVSWLEVGRVVNGKAPASEYAPVRLQVRDIDADKWHSYEVAGTCGLLSEAVVGLIGQYMTEWFEFLEAWINDLPFFFLREKGTLNCLDRDQSVLVPFPGEPDSIMSIDRCRFLKGRIPDPAVFAIPEISWHLFGTTSIKRKIEATGLKGLYFFDAEW